MTEWLNDRPEYSNKVIGGYIENFIDDSYDNAVYVDPEAGTVDSYEVGYANWHMPYRTDITEENFRMFLKNADGRYLAGAIERDRNNARAITNGKYVEVVKGRKVPLHTKGTVFYTKEMDIRDRWGNLRDVVTKVGLKDADGKAWWTYASNCVVIDPAKYFTPVQELNRKVKAYKSEAYRQVIMEHRKVTDWYRNQKGFSIGSKFTIY